VPIIPATGNSSPSSNKGGAIHKVGTPKPLSAVSNAIRQKPVKTTTNEAAKKEKSFLVNIAQLDLIPVGQIANPAQVYCINLP
jgi:hypothetical protein